MTMTDPEDLIEEDIGGVQGDAPESETGDDGDSAADTSVSVQAPDAGEIEWAGELVKKAPGPSPD
jgi:hypothetical protein